MGPIAQPDSLGHEPTLNAASDASTHPVGAVGEGERLVAGDAVGDYVIDKFLGAGAMGEVYGGHHPVIGKKVAVKLLRKELASSPEAAERFVREARAANQIDHPNVIDIFNFGRLPNGRLFLVMDLVAGTSLRARVGKLELPETLAILAAIAEALDAAHARGVVHRDLKPDNVMLSNDTPPKVFVLDFGIAKLVKAAELASGSMQGNGTLTGQGTWLGTPGYMAPEQWSSDGAGPASDRYAFGIMAFELIAGKLPFTAANLPAMMEQHFRGVVPKLADALDPIFERALAKTPEARYPTAIAIVDALRTASSTTVGAAVARETAKQGGKRVPWIPAAIGTGVLGMSILGVLAVRNSRHEEPDAPPDPAAASPAPGTVEIIVLSTPTGATVKENGDAIGVTPKRLHPKPGTRLAIALTKPGYEPATTELTAPARGASETARTVALTLLPITGFEGVWRLSNGELRELRRAGDRVDIYKRTAVTGPAELYRSYEMIAADAGLAFAGTEDVMLRSCLVPHKIVYHYDPRADVLEVQRERVGSKPNETGDGKCTIVSREPGAKIALTRVDADGDVRYSDAPVGKPITSNNNADDTFDNELDAKLKGGNDAGPKDNSNAKTTPPKAPPPTPKQGRAATVSPDAQRGAIDAQRQQDLAEKERLSKAAAAPKQPPPKQAPQVAPQQANEPITQQVPNPAPGSIPPDVEPAPQQQITPQQRKK